MTTAQIIPMRPEVPQFNVIADRPTVTLAQLAQRSQVPEGDLLELVGYGLFEPVGPGAEPAWFSTDCIAVARHAGRLRKELALDSHAFALAVMFVHECMALKDEVRSLRFELRHRQAQ